MWNGDFEYVGSVTNGSTFCLNPVVGGLNYSTGGNTTCPAYYQNAYLFHDCVSCTSNGQSWADFGGIGVCTIIRDFVAFQGALAVNNASLCRNILLKHRI